MPRSPLRAHAAFLFLFFLFGITHLFAQVPAEYRSLTKGKTPAAQVILLDSIAASLKKDKPAESFSLLRVTIKLAAANKLDSLEIAQRITMARMLRARGESDASIGCLDTAIATAKRANLPALQAGAMNQKGISLTRMGDYPAASKVLFDAIAIAEAIHDTSMVAVLKQHCGMMYFYATEFHSAIDYTKQALALFTLLNDSQSIAANLDNVGLYYSNLEQNDSAYHYQLQALDIFRELGDSSRLIVSYNNMGALLMRTKKYTQAELYLRQSLEMATRRHDDYRILTALASLGQLYVEMDDDPKAIETNEKAYALAVTLKDDYHSQQAANQLGQSYYRSASYERAAYYYRISDELRDKVFDEEKNKAIDEVSQKYEAKQRTKQIQLLLAEKSASDTKIQRDRLLKAIFIVIAAALLFFSVVIVRRYTQKKKDNLLLQEKNDAIARQKEQIEEKNSEILDSINYATRIQNAVLPSGEKLRALFPQSFIYFHPRDIISGDFYWIGETNDGVKFLAVADCTGHGVPGALMSMLGSSLLTRLFSNEALRSPGPMLDHLHENLIRALNESVDARSVNDGMDIALLLYDPAARKVVIASAGRPVYYCANGELETIKPDKISIGSSLPKTASYKETTINLTGPVQLYLFSDGITDQFGGPEGKKFMSRRLQELIAQQQENSLTERERHFTETFDNWKAGYEQTDDMTLIHIEIC